MMSERLWRQCYTIARARYEVLTDKMREHPVDPNLSFLSFKATKGFRK